MHAWRACARLSHSFCMQCGVHSVDTAYLQQADCCRQHPLPLGHSRHLHMQAQQAGECEQVGGVRAVCGGCCRLSAMCAGCCGALHSQYQLCCECAGCLMPPIDRGSSRASRRGRRRLARRVCIPVRSNLIPLSLIFIILQKNVFSKVWSLSNAGILSCTETLCVKTNLRGATRKSE